MMRISALAAAAALLLAGCFVFDNPVENSAGSTVTFQVVVTSVSYGGTYVWNPTDSAYEATVANTRYYLYTDSSRFWCLATQLNQTHTSGCIASSSTANCALPPVYGLNWIPTEPIASVDDSSGGICRTLVAADSPALTGTTIQATFKASGPGNSATYQWQMSSSQTGIPSIPLTTGPLLALTTSEKFQWIRVVITPTDGNGNAVGAPVTSPPVWVSS